MLDVFQPPVEQDPEEGYPLPCPEDEEFFFGLDAAGMGEAIGKFLDGLEGQERRSFEGIHKFLTTLPVPAPNDSKGKQGNDAR